MAQGHTATEWQNWEFKDSNPGSLAADPHLLDHYLVAHPSGRTGCTAEDTARSREKP